MGDLNNVAEIAQDMTHAWIASEMPGWPNDFCRRCKIGSDDPLASKPCPGRGDPQIDYSFTGLQAQQLALFSKVTSDRDRLREVVQTIHANAIRVTPETETEFVALLRSLCAEVLFGKSAYEAICLQDIGQVASHLRKECGAS